MKIVVAFGEFTEDVVSAISGQHEVIRAENNLDAIIASSGKIIEPEILLTSGVVLTAMKEGRINRGASMLDRLKKIRSIWPRTKIVLILPEDVPDNVIQAVISLGIYNVYRVEVITKDELLAFLEQDKNYNQVLEPLLPEVEDFKFMTGQTNKKSTRKINKIPPTKIETKQKDPGKDTDLIILATGDDSINESIRTSVSFSAVTVTNREELLQKVLELKPSVVVLSPGLPGELDILEVVYQVQRVTAKVVFIAVNLTPTDITLIRIRELGVEVIEGYISIGAILKTLFKLTGTYQTVDYEEVEVEDEEDYKRSLSKIAKVGSEFAKNLTNISKIKLKQKQSLPNEKLVTVVSPIPAGKTFVAVNLATMLAQMGYRTVLIDAELHQQSTHTWLNCPSEERGLLDALETDEPLLCSYNHPMISNLYVLNKDPYLEESPITTKSFIKIINALNETEEVDVIIADTSSDISEPLTRSIMDIAASVILVADQDFSHLTKMQLRLDKLENSFEFNKFTLLVNRMVDSQNLEVSDAEKAAGLQADGVVPERSKEVLESIRTGIPATLFCPDIYASLEEFWRSWEQRNISELA